MVIHVVRDSRMYSEACGQCECSLAINLRKYSTSVANFHLLEVALITRMYSDSYTRGQASDRMQHEQEENITINATLEVTQQILLQHCRQSRNTRNIIWVYPAKIHTSV